MPEKFQDSHATRIIAALQGRAKRKTKDGAQISTTWGTVGAVDSANKFASAYLYGETDGAYMSAGFRIPETMYLTVGDKVKVGINYATGERWIEEAHFPPTTYKKIALDAKNGKVLVGDGTVPPVEADLSILGTITTFIKTLLDDADATAARATLGLGSLATLSSLAHSALTGIGANDHHNQAHDHSSASDGVDISPATVRVTSTTDLTLTSTGHGLQVGPSSGFNLALDPNEVMARNNGNSATLALNNDGGLVTVNATGGTTGLSIGNAAPLTLGSDFAISRVAPNIAAAASGDTIEASGLSSVVPAKVASSGSITLSTTITDITGASITFTPRVPETVLVIGVFDFDYTVPSTAVAIGYLAVDGGAEESAQALYKMNGGTSGRITATQTWIVNLSAASHTLKLRGAKNNAVGTVTAGGQHTTLTVVRFIT